jgi:hypothetical protein
MSAGIVGELGRVDEVQTQLYCHSKLELEEGFIRKASVVLSHHNPGS